MKSLRIFLLTLLVLVLPLRGALAAVAHCAAGLSGQAGSAVVQVHDDHAHHHGPTPATVAAPAEAQPSPAGSDAAVTPDACKFCTASCAVPPVLSALPPLLTFAPLPEAAFPALVAPPPSHLADALDRPPQRA